MARDNNCCQFPSCGSTRKLEVHHIKKWSEHKHLRTAIFNGITLCSKCHDRIGGNEEAYEAFFFNLVRANGQSNPGVAPSGTDPKDPN